jgi:hypothetical protein
MTTTTQSPPALDYDATPLRPRAGKAARIVGWILSVLPALMLLMAAAMSLSHSPQVMEGMNKYGFSEKAATFIGIAALASALLYLLPPTAVLGAILMTGYFGGAVVTHLRAQEPFFVPVLVGVVVWLGLFLRDPRLRVLIPFRR